ncbi:IS3 family transposase [Nostocoides sp. F2B08]|uniref:IS3 family transposase n=1 Tax=Nostocoides sp. F2B08 TaxID=2653936 RepID=UPI0012632B52|nr:IS3 family transposase [Tetrasphaera sp. F2B08]
MYGARKLHIAARRARIYISRDQVARLMRLAGIAGAFRGRHHTRTTVRDATAPRTQTWSSGPGTPPPTRTSCG